MNRIKWMAILLIAIMVVAALTACGGGSGTAAIIKPVSDEESVDGSKVTLLAAGGNNRLGLGDLELDTGKTIAVAVVTRINEPEGYTYIGTGVEGFPETGQESWGFDCDVLYYFNYDRLREAVDSDEDEEAAYHYFNLGGVAWYGSKALVKKLETRPYDAFKGDITAEFVENLKKTNWPLSYSFYIDKEYQIVKEGDTILIAVDPQQTFNANYPRIKEHWYNAVVAPFASDHPQPYLVRFIDGKLQLDGDMADAFTLYRLYDDTNPELTGIKDGDSVETVVNFLKAVEQDMIRYEEEMRQQPVQADRS